MQVICILNNKVVGVFGGATTKEDMETQNPGFVCYQTNLQTLVPGKIYDPTTDTLSDDPEYIPPTIPDLQPEQVYRKITQLAFLNRFTDTEAIGIDLASQGTTVQAAALRRYQSKINAAKFIDLESPETQGGIYALETLGLLAEGRASEILNNPVQDHEKA